MVIAAFADGLASLAPLLAQAQEAPQYQFEQLDPPTRARVLAALTGLVILMFGLMVLAAMGARWVRAYGHRTPLSFERRSKPAVDPDDWARKPLHPKELGEDESSPG